MAASSYSNGESQSLHKASAQDRYVQECFENLRLYVYQVIASGGARPYSVGFLKSGIKTAVIKDDEHRVTVEVTNTIAEILPLLYLTENTYANYQLASAQVKANHIRKIKASLPEKHSLFRSQGTQTFYEEIGERTDDFLSYQFNQNICLYTYNINDGIGDTVAAFRVVEETRNALSTHFIPIVLLIKIQDNSPVDTLLRLIQDKIHLVNLIYLLVSDPDDDKYKNLSEGIVIVSQDSYLTDEGIKQHFESCMTYVDIANQLTLKDVGYEFSNVLAEHIPTIRVHELGLGGISSSENHSVFLGLSKGGGLWLKDYPAEDATARAARLLSFNNRDYVELLVGKKNPSLEDAKQYLEKTAFLPGYVQNDYQALFFIMSFILKYCDSNNVLEKSCDFHIPRNSVNEALFRQAMRDLHLDKSVLTFVNNQEPTQSHYSQSAGPRIRIISGYFLDDDDYDNLYRISNDGAACSGDNTFQHVMSTHHPAFLTGCTTVNQFLKFFALRQFKEVLDKYLPDYAALMLAKEDIKIFDPHLGKGQSAEQKDQQYQQILNKIQQIAKTMSDPDFHKNWAAFRRFVHDNYNYTKPFYSLIHHVLKLSPEISTDDCNTIQNFCEQNVTQAPCGKKR